MAVSLLKSVGVDALDAAVMRDDLEPVKLASVLLKLVLVFLARRITMTHIVVHEFHGKTRRSSLKLCRPP